MLYDKTSYTRSTIQRDDGSQLMVGEVVVKPPYCFEVHAGLSESRQLKLNDTAHLQLLKAIARGISEPTVVVWDAFPQTETFAVPRLDLANSGLVRLSKNACITHALRSAVRRQNLAVHRGRPKVKAIQTEEDRQAGLYLEMLTAEQRLIAAGYGGDTPNFTASQVVAVGGVGFPSRHAKERGYPVVVNASYFLFEPEDFESDFSVYGEPYGLHIHQGDIKLPPLFARSALLFTRGGGAALRQVSLRDMTISCLGREWDLQRFSLNAAGPYAVFNRYYGVVEGCRTRGTTERNPGNVDFIVIGNAIVGYKVGGEAEIPHNGFVLSLPKEELQSGEFDPVVKYRFTTGEEFGEGIQCGPGLVNDGEIVLDHTTLTKEQFFRKRHHCDGSWDAGVVPTDYAADINRTRAARIAIGVGFSGELVILAVEAVNRGMEEDSRESSGVTLEELARLAHASGCRCALNMDGGGSANIQYIFGHLIRGADRRGLPGVIYERMVPSVGVVRLLGMEDYSC